HAEIATLFDCACAAELDLYKKYRNPRLTVTSEADWTILRHMARGASAKSRLGKWCGGLGPPLPARRPMQVEPLRLVIWEKLQDGRPPHERISRAQSGPADGQKCDACESSLRWLSSW